MAACALPTASQLADVQTVNELLSYKQRFKLVKIMVKAFRRFRPHKLDWYGGQLGSWCI